MRDGLLWFAAFAGCVASTLIFLISGGASSLATAVEWVAHEAETAALFFAPTITVAQLQEHYRGGSSGTETASAPADAPPQKVKVLIVPGHQPFVGGTTFGGVDERDVVADIAEALAALLRQNPHYEVLVARTKSEWHPVLLTYFDTHALEIDTFRQSLKEQMTNYLEKGTILPAADQVYHNTTPSTAARQLYGINKWAGENGYDITLHLHINDDAERRWSRAGTYSGFAVYVPDRQYSNAEASKAIGAALARRLSAYHATSTLPREDRGVVEDQQLIAVGSNNSARNVALLIEYGYIYEPQFQNASVRPVAVSDYAFQTYLGLQDFFQDPVVATTGSVSFPYDWTEVTGNKRETGSGVYALQAALRHLGYYPPAGKSFSECPISGSVGACTRSALLAFQRAQGIEATGLLNAQTRTALKRDLSR